MEKNGILYSTDGHKRIADNTLVALTLMIAESRTEEKDVMVKVVINLINKDNNLKHPLLIFIKRNIEQKLFLTNINSYFIFCDVTKLSYLCKR